MSILFETSMKGIGNEALIDRLRLRREPSIATALSLPMRRLRQDLHEGDNGLRQAWHGLMPILQLVWLVLCLLISLADCVNSRSFLFVALKNIGYSLDPAIQLALTTFWLLSLPRASQQRKQHESTYRASLIDRLGVEPGNARSAKLSFACSCKSLFG